MDQQQMSRKQAVNSPEVALASEVFDQFCNATTLKSILGYYRHLCELLKIRPNVINQFYPKLKSKLRSWKAQALWKKFDQRASHKCYCRGKACLNTRVLIIGGGPCGLRSAIEAQLLGAKVVVIEKRDRMSRNNVLHLWPFVIQDLRGLGAKKFFGKFCAGSIDHISIRQLQCILLKVALILGVEFHESVSFDSLIQPPDNQKDGKIGWRAKTLPIDHPVSQYEFDVLIGADGKRNTLEGFKRKEFRGKLAIAITANFINKRTEAEARVEEISGVAFIFNQKFFKELYQETGIDLENIVYYKDDTHYFVMTAKKHSLIDKGVILQDHADTAKLLAKENVDREALMLYAREAAEFSTEYQMVDMEFAVNHYGQPDVAMFDFTSMYAAENASRILERHSHRLFMILVGDSLLEPFWPTGSGCARGFLSSLDAGWAIKSWGASLSPLEVIAERESIYRLLGQTTPENLNRDYAAYTLDPHTRYPNLNVRAVTPIQICSLLDTDDPESIKQPVVHPEIDIPKKRRRRDMRIDTQTQVHPDILLRWLQKQVALYDNIHIEDMGASFKDGLAVCAIIHRYRPDLIDFYNLNAEDIVKNNQLAFDTLEKELDIKPIMTGEEMAQCDVPDKLTMFSYLTQIYEAFRGEIPYIKHPKLEHETEDDVMHLKQLNQLISEQKITKSRRSSRHISDVQSYVDKKVDIPSRRSRKRRSTEKMGVTMDETQKIYDEIEKHQTERMKKRQYLRQMAIQQFYKSMRMLQANAKREKNEPFEDYAISLYRQTAPDFKDRVKDLEQKILYPDRESKIHVSYQKGSMDEDFSGRIRNFEDKLKGTTSSEKKPKDLLRAIGKIEKTDWNVKEIEKKIEENKMGRGVRHDRLERVPKWSREQFLARQIKMEKRGNDQKDTYSKYADIDNTLKSIGKKIQEGSALGYNKVSAMAEQFSNKNQDAEPKMQKSRVKPTIVLPAQGGSEICHFCNKRVYLMERLTTEGRFFHRGCFRCEYCTISLRIGNHTFDREKNGGRFYCAQHFGLLGTMKTKVEKKKSNSINKENEPNTAITSRIPEKVKISLEGVTGLDLLDRGQTPERIEFENLAGILDPEEAHSQMDEDEWTDRNFGASTAEMGSSEEISEISDSDEDNEIFEEAIDQPLTTEGTLELAKNWTLRYSNPHATIGQSDTGSNEYEESSDEYTSEDDESETATEDEEDVRARELRKKEVWLKMPPRNSDTDTGSETEVKNFLDPIDLIPTQESFISADFKIISSNIDINNCVHNRDDHEKPSEFSKVIALISSNLNINTCNQDNLISTNKNDISPTINLQASDCIINSAGSIHSFMSNNDDVLNQNEFLVPLTNVTANNYLTKEDRDSKYENFVDKNIVFNLSDQDNSFSRENLRNEVFYDDIVNFRLTPTDFTINADDFINVNTIITNSALPLSVDNQKRDFAQDNQSSLKQTAKIANATSCTKIDKDFIISDSKSNLIVNEFPGVITSLRKSRNSLSSSSSDIYQSTEMLYNDSVISNSMNNSIKFLESLSNLPVEVKKHKCEDISVIKKSEDFIINQSSNVNLSNNSGNIELSDITDKEINALTIIPIVTANVQRELVCPIVTVTSPLPTQEKQFEELSVQTLRLLPQNSHVVTSFVDCENSFDKLKQDLKQRKARNKAVKNELKPLSAERARLKINKYFMENKKPFSRSQSTWNEETEEAPKIEIIKLDIKPKLSDKINTEEILKYFNNSNFSNKRDKYKSFNIIKTAVKQNDCRKLEIDIGDISDMNKKDINIFDKEFNEIEEHSNISYLIENNQIDSECNLSLQVCGNEEEIKHTIICDNLSLVHSDLIELHPELNVHTNYADSRMLTHNMLKLDNNDNNIPDLNTELKNNILMLHTATVSNFSIPLTDEKNNIHIDIIKKGKDMKKIDHTENTLKGDIKNINKEKEIKMKLNDNMLESGVIKENIVKINLQNNISNNINRIKQTIKINSLNDEKDKNKKLNRNLSFKDKIYLNAESSVFLLLQNNMDDAIKCNMSHKSYINLSKSDTNLSKSTPWVDCKDIRYNSKSLFELRNMVDKVAPTVKVANIEKIVDESNNIKDVKVTKNNSTQNCIKEVRKEIGQKHLSVNINVSPKNFSTKTYISTTSSYAESTLPKIPVRRKKIAKKNAELLNRNQDNEDTSKVQNSIVQDMKKLYAPANNNVSDIQKQNFEEDSNIKSQNVNIEEFQNRNINNVSENQRIDVSKPQNHNAKDILKPPNQNIIKTLNQHVTSHESFDNEIVRDSKIMAGTQDSGFINIPKILHQNEKILSIKKTYHANWNLSDKLEESVKVASRNNQSKKDKCIIS